MDKFLFVIFILALFLISYYLIGITTLGQLIGFALLLLVSIHYIQKASIYGAGAAMLYFGALNLSYILGGAFGIIFK